MVYKDDSSTVVTRGLVNEVYSRVDLDGDGKLTDELGVVYGMTLKPFTESGDSGAFGFIIGGLNVPSNLGYRVYNTDIKMLWDEIEQATRLVKNQGCQGLSSTRYSAGALGQCCLFYS